MRFLVPRQMKCANSFGQCFCNLNKLSLHKTNVLSFWESNDTFWIAYIIFVLRIICAVSLIVPLFFFVYSIVEPWNPWDYIPSAPANFENPHISPWGRGSWKGVGGPLKICEAFLGGCQGGHQETPYSLSLKKSRKPHPLGDQGWRGRETTYQLNVKGQRQNGHWVRPRSWPLPPPPSPFPFQPSRASC